MKAKALLPLTAMLLIGSVVGQRTSTPAPDSVIQTPAFSVAVSLSKRAHSRLQQLKESVIVAAYLDGDGQPEPGIDTSPMRAVVLGSEEREVNSELIAEFKGVKVTPSAWKRLSDKNYYVTINVFSARKVLRDNILSCSVPIKRVEAVKGRTIEVQCELIGERSY